MTHASPPARAMSAAETVPSERVIRLLRWSLALFFVGAGAAKLIGVPAAVSLFAKVGLGQWFRYAVGLYELVGAALLAYRRTTVAGTIALSALMLGAGATEMLILERLPLSSGATLAALVLLAVLVRAADRGVGRFP